MYLTLDAHSALYLTLYKLYIAKFIDKNQIIEKDLKELFLGTITKVRDYHASNNVSIKRNHKKLLDTKVAIEFPKLQKEFDGNLKSKCKLYMNMIFLRNFFCLSEHQGNRTRSSVCAVCTDCVQIFYL